MEIWGYQTGVRVAGPPRSEIPFPQFGSPSSMAVQISNRNVTPLTDVEYSCEVSKLTLATGSAVRDAKVLIRGASRKIPARSRDGN